SKSVDLYFPNMKNFTLYNKANILLFNYLSKFNSWALVLIIFIFCINKPHLTRNHHLLRDQDKYQEVIAEIGGRNNYLLFITYFSDNNVKWTRTRNDENKSTKNKQDYQMLLFCRKQCYQLNMMKMITLSISSTHNIKPFYAYAYVSSCSLVGVFGIIVLFQNQCTSIQYEEKMDCI
ncbi:hypothetical protein RFI_01768, partial [Reticulomyxa filosa]